MTIAQLPHTNQQQLWDFLLPAGAVVLIVLAIIGLTWRLISWLDKRYVLRAEHREIKDRVVKLEVIEATQEKLDGKLDKIVGLLEKRRNSHD